MKKKTGNRITPGQVIREIVVKHRVKRELVQWLKEYGNQKLGQEKKIVNGKQVKDLCCLLYTSDLPTTPYV